MNQASGNTDLLWKSGGRIIVAFLTWIILGCPFVYPATTGSSPTLNSAVQKPRKTWSEAVAEIERENEKFRKTTNHSLSSMRNEQKRLRSLKRNLAIRAQQQERELERQRKAFNRLLAFEEKLNAEIAAENEELKTLEGTVRAASKEADALIRENPTTIESPQRTDLVSRLLSPDHFPTLPEIEALSDLFFEESRLSAQIKKREGEFIDAGGGIRRGEIIRLGTFTSYYRTGADEASGNSWAGSLKNWVLGFWDPELISGTESIGFLKPDTASKTMVAIPQRIPQAIEESFTHWVSGRSESVPVDVSRGAVFQLLNKEKGLKDTVAKGGIIAMLILLLGLIAIFIGIERLLVLLRARKASEKDFSDILIHVSGNKIEKCRELCQKKKRIPTYRVLHRILEFAHSDRTVLENAAEESIMKELPRLERFLPTLGILYAIAPLLGLLGTVTGMINTFQVISAFGTGDPKMMSGGISEALITTQLGLAVAVPIMLFHHYLERRVDKALADMEEKSATLTVALMEKNTSESEPPYVDHAA